MRPNEMGFHGARVMVLILGLGMLAGLERRIASSLPDPAGVAPPRVDDDFPDGDRLPVAGMSLAVLGGFRVLVADALWIKVHLAWQRRDLAAMRAGLGWVGTIDPRPLAFWLNGARMLGYDAAAWRAAEVGPVRARREQLAEAREYLQRARTHHPGRAAIAVEEAVLVLRLGDDDAGALAALERAGDCADAPYFVGRVRAELLIRLGRDREALAWLRQYRATLPADDPRALTPVVDQRIADLAARLGTESFLFGDDRR